MNISNSEQMTVESRYERQENAGVEVWMWLGRWFHKEEKLTVCQAKQPQYIAGERHALEHGWREVNKILLYEEQ